MLTVIKVKPSESVQFIFRDFFDPDSDVILYQCTFDKDTVFQLIKDLQEMYD